MVRSHLAYSMELWPFYLKKDTAAELEKTQARATKTIKRLEHLS